MARDNTAIVKRSRREGVALHPKAHKVMVRRKNTPGSQGTLRKGKPSQYALQLREKQKVKRLYGLLERQFRRVVKEAIKNTGVSGEVLLQFLERRLDNVIYRANLSVSRQAARQLVSHRHFTVNNRRINIPSFRVKQGDVIALYQGSKNNAYFKNILETIDKGQNYSWFSFNKKDASITITGLPQREEAEPDINEALIIEFYSR